MAEKQTTIPEDLNVFYVRSASESERLYKVCEKGGAWHCSGADGSFSGACNHFKYHGERGPPCRHILEGQLKSLYISFKTGKDLFEAICRETARKRDIRDAECMDFDSVIEMLWTFKGEKMVLITNLMLKLAVIRGQVTTDDVHDATNERFYNDKTIGAASGGLLRTGLLRVIGRQPTKRECAHGRGINVFAITEKGINFLNAQRPEGRIETFAESTRLRCNSCHVPMKGTSAYDGACECGGLIEKNPTETS